MMLELVMLAVALAVDEPDVTGWIVDAQTGRPPAVSAVVHATWVMRKDKATRQVVREAQSAAGGRYYVLDWKQFVDTRGGWTLVPGLDPVVRIYAPGYRRLVVENARRAKGDEWSWIGEKQTQELKPLPATELARELGLWRRDIDGDLAQLPPVQRDGAIRDREKLILLFDQLCSQLKPAPTGLCYPADSPVGRFVAQSKADRAKHLVVEIQDGKPQKFRIEATPASQVTPSVPGPGYSPAKP